MKINTEFTLTLCFYYMLITTKEKQTMPDFEDKTVYIIKNNGSVATLRNTVNTFLQVIEE